MSRIYRSALLALIAVMVSLTVAAAEPTTIGRVAFENSGSAQAQAPFHRGLALLHNFEYDRAASAFREAQAADPDFAMAYWGEAMTFNHAIWQEQDREAARAVLSRLDPDPATRRAKASTAREQAYLDAVETLYGQGDKRDRDFVYADKMAALHRTWPEDVDARAFYALSLLGLAHDGRDFALYMRAAALLEEAFPDNPDHPGVLHYLIHSYDDPVHAPLGLRAARRYGDVAPDAAHALHMTSHIFIAMGMWDDVVAMNERAVAAVNRRRFAAGQPATRCGHYNEWLAYGYLQRGEVGRADAIVSACGSEAVQELGTDPIDGALEGYRSSVYSHADIALRRLVDTGSRAGGEAPELPDGRYLAAQLLRAYGDILASRGDRTRLRAARSELESTAAAIGAELRAGAKPGRNPIPESRIEILLLQADGLEKLAAGESDAGIAALHKAAATEAYLPAAYGPPAIPKPSFELLAEELEALGRSDEARAAYERARAAAPGRRLVTQGLERIARR